jgi:CRISPR/Cas system-associated exonuclease Cas4 (RecB family)
MTETKGGVITPATVRDLCSDILAKRTQRLESSRKVYPRERFNCSDIVACDRYMVYSILNWSDKRAWDPGMIARFEVGNLHEKSIVGELLAMGYDLTYQNIPFDIKNRSGEVMCRGKIDGMISFDGNRYPMEIKTLNVNVWSAIDSLDDFQRKEWLRKYIRQIQMYLYGNDREQGMFLIEDCLGHWKLIPVEIDYAECERTLQQLERCWEYVKAKKYPKPIPYSQEMCENCMFAGVCLRDIPAESRMDFSTDKDLELACERYMELKPLKSEYEKLDKLIKGKVEPINENKDVIVGESRYRINIKCGTRKQYDVPEELELQYEKIVPTKRVSVIDLNKLK